ncbi:MAG: hypothetical protein M3279_09080, partial [Actinomycetota bacterium]|nr:hypothetical protein [Actinomycetota bacterium]
MSPLRVARSGRGRSRHLPVLVAGCLGAAAAYAALGLLPAVRHEVGPATLEAALAPGAGRTVLRI